MAIAKPSAINAESLRNFLPINKPAPKRVKLVRSSYQPSKANMEEVIDIRKADGTMPTPEELAQFGFSQ